MYRTKFCDSAQFFKGEKTRKKKKLASFAMGKQQYTTLTLLAILAVFFATIPLFDLFCKQ
jgi:cytochrome c oxidase assembly protein Cox11